MSSTEEVKKPAEISPEGADNSISSTQEEEAAKKKYGRMTPKKPLLSKDQERSYFDSADWALNKQGAENSNLPPEILRLRPKQQPTQKQSRYRKSPMAPSGVQDGNVAAASVDAVAND